MSAKEGPDHGSLMAANSLLTPAPVKMPSGARSNRVMDIQFNADLEPDRFKDAHSQQSNLTQKT